MLNRARRRKKELKTVLTFTWSPSLTSFNSTGILFWFKQCLDQIFIKFYLTEDYLWKTTAKNYLGGKMSKNFTYFAVYSLFLHLKEQSCNLLKPHTIFYSYFSHAGQNDNPRRFHRATETWVLIRVFSSGLEGRQCLWQDTSPGNIIAQVFWNKSPEPGSYSNANSITA